MPPRAAFAFGLAAGLAVVYFLGLLQGLSLGTLLFRAAVGGLAFGAFCGMLVFMLGDPFEIPPPSSRSGEGDHEGSEAPSSATDRQSNSRDEGA
ncbi:MAG: hypothetical protein V5A50_12595 [Thiohalorhabdus sp.]|uniref:hypothetical protein n=1 Tax=Thiohalorhabdus sp. TaxID=3094134 RepID=UPI002FC36A42